MDSFFTPGGLKIRLNLEYFYSLVADTTNFYTDNDIINNGTIANCRSAIESIYTLPTVFIQIYTLIAVISHTNIFQYCIIVSALYFFGCIWRCTQPIAFITGCLGFISSIYRKLSLLFYIGLIVLFFSLDCKYLIIPYIGFRFASFIFSLLLSHITMLITKRKYGEAFGDEEICAFRTFHIYTNSPVNLTTFIYNYITHCKTEPSPFHLRSFLAEE